MRIYAGIDEAGYGPLFGPLTVGRAVYACDDPTRPANSPARPADSPPRPGDFSRLAPSAQHTPDLWQTLRKAVCKTPRDAKGRIAVNDSKKLHQSRSRTGLKHLELGVLAFVGLAGHRPTCVSSLLDTLGEDAHHQLNALPWYHATDDTPWQPLPTSCTTGELAVARGMLIKAATEANVKLLDVGAAVVFEDRFNRMVAATRSKATTSFTFVARHLDAIWQRFGAAHPTVVVDRQSGRRHYREQLALVVPNAQVTVLAEDDSGSAYQLTQGDRSMTVRFEVDADARHMPVALASMVSKYTRELMMARFQAWFAKRAPEVKPTAGYASDAKRFWTEIQPRLSEWSIQPESLRRMA